jgi:uncharacterized protein
MQIEAVALTLPEGCNIVVGQSHFIKTVEDLAEIAVAAVPGIEFGLAFCEASGPCLVRAEGNSEDLVAQAVAAARAVGAGHTFYLLMRRAFPINLLNDIKGCAEVCQVFCATANPLQVLVVRGEQGAGVVGVIDGAAPRGVEGPAEKKERVALLRRFGYKRGQA